MSDEDRVRTGIEGLDHILCGGLIDRRGYLLRGGPGTGKTTVGTHFLAEGVRRGESALFITLGESEEDLRKNARGIGIDTAGIHFLDLSPDSKFFAGAESYDLFSAAEVDRDPVTKKIVACVNAHQPRRVFLDSTSHLRYLAIDTHQFRKQLLSFTRFLLEMNAIVVFTSEGSRAYPDDDVMYLSDGVINLALLQRMRTIEITKFRGSDFQPGEHTLKLTDCGARVHPRIVPARHGRPYAFDRVRSGLPAVDALLHGGLERGTVTILAGPAGVGKTTLAMQFAAEAAAQSLHTTVFTFEESIHSLVHRCESVQIPLTRMVEQGNLKIIPVEPLHLTADEISALVRHEVEVKGSSCVVIDGIAGFRMSIVGDVQHQLRALFKYLTNMGVSVMAINETETITGDFRVTEIGISYMADNIVFLRYLELRGEMRKAIGVLKKRLGDFERQLREFSITDQGLKVGEPLTNLRGILNGVPEWIEETRDQRTPG